MSASILDETLKEAEELHHNILGMMQLIEQHKAQIERYKANEVKLEQRIKELEEQLKARSDHVSRLQSNIIEEHFPNRDVYDNEDIRDAIRSGRLRL